MDEMPASPYVEARGAGYYISGTRISLDSVAHALRRGESVQDILADFPALQSREKLEGAIAFIEACPIEVERYLATGERLWQELQSENAPEIVERIRKYTKATGRKTA